MDWVPLPPRRFFSIYVLSAVEVLLHALFTIHHHKPLLPAMPMAMESPTQPLLSTAYVKKTPFFLSSTKWVLKIVMWALFIFWATLIFLFPAEPVNEQLFVKWIDISSGTFFGITGTFFLVFSGPILIIACLAVVYLAISDSGEEELKEQKTSKCPRFRLWTFPVLVDGLFGVVSAAEFIGILLFIAFIVWAVCAFTLENFSLLAAYHLPSKLE